MRKRIQAALLIPIVTSVSLLASCSDEQTSGGGDVVLTWLVRSDPNLIEWEHRVIEAFEDENPGIRVQLQTIPQGEIDQKLQTMIAGGNVPDVWSPNWADSGFGSYYAMGALKDLTPFF